MEHLDTGLITQFGLMQKISTGNMVFDMALMFMMPVILKYAVGYWAELKEWIARSWQKPTSKYVRKIEYTRHQGWYWYSDSDNNRNKVLQESILMFLDGKHDVVEKFKDASYKLTTAPSDEVDNADDSESDSDCGKNDEIRQYRIQIVPPEGIWFDVEPGIEFMKSQHETDNGDNKGKTIVTFTFQSALKDGQSKIDDFVDRALALYKSKMAQKKDTARYLYTPQFSYTKSPNDEDSKSGMIYKRYQLSEEKTFASFFHPGKEELLRLIDHFANKRGKFAIPGYPHKLGVLLHGPPGTGKTSLIKAVAQYTHRHIISIPLSRVRTNQELMDLVFNQACSVEGDSWNYKLPFKKTIFVMEDIDAACDVVKRRAGAVARYEKAAVGPENDPQKDDEKKGEDDKDGDPPASPSSEKGEAKVYTSAYLDKLMAESDDLNLAGVLNVLDGVVDCPNRIVVMTTNHPEKLDPALIRPGRINKQIYLGYLRLEEALQMAEHYFGALAEADKQSIASVFPDRVMSPAALESLCAECDVVDDLVKCIKDKHPECVSWKTRAEAQAIGGSCDVVGDMGGGKISDQSRVDDSGPVPPMVAPEKVPDVLLTPKIGQLESASMQVVAA
ncbi:unnamed protein product [Ostreobium quekettii]|uniref:AAA+ ATPase domain-containing protein n=1 Tax=Ostreobium quekettii TaxID=121088 RepID=A0A8S1J6D9_9CHLO|nr:unnamed protein product [Ostreobium quekettii]